MKLSKGEPKLRTTGYSGRLAFAEVIASLFLVLLSVVLISGCAHSEKERRSTDRWDLIYGGQADGAAFGVSDSFTFGKSQKVRPPNDFQFYFKECDPTSPALDHAFFSKTAYSCSSAPTD